jgi:hypothetical protein
MVQRYDFRGFTDRAQNGSITPIPLERAYIKVFSSGLCRCYTLDNYRVVSCISKYCINMSFNQC